MVKDVNNKIKSVMEISMQVVFQVVSFYPHTSTKLLVKKKNIILV